jgi:Putative zincin peptidase
MFFIPGFIITAVTFPGVIVHELAHQLFCRWFKVPVFKVVYFQFGNPAGYVLHEVPKSKMQTIMISIGPFFLNTIVGALIALPAALPVFTFDTATLLDYFLIYLGVSIAMHAFPSTGDAGSIWSAINEKDTPLWIKIIGYPVVGLIYIGSLGSFFWLDLIYGIAIVFIIPKLIIYFLT